MADIIVLKKEDKIKHNFMIIALNIPVYSSLIVLFRLKRQQFYLILLFHSIVIRLNHNGLHGKLRASHRSVHVHNISTSTFYLQHLICFSFIEYKPIYKLNSQSCNSIYWLILSRHFFASHCQASIPLFLWQLVLQNHVSA